MAILPKFEEILKKLKMNVVKFSRKNLGLNNLINIFHEML